MNTPLTAIRGPVLTYTGDAFSDGLESTMRYEPDAIIAMAGGRITHFGPASEVRAQLPDDIVVNRINLNDQTVEGLRHKKKPIYCVQYHPEASPGPHDSKPLFAEFRDLVEKKH